MEEQYIELLRTKCSEASYAKLAGLSNSRLNSFVAEYARLCCPESIYVCDDSVQDAQYIRKQTLKNKEEQTLAIAGHTIHFDGPQDQARDKANTKYLLSPGTKLGASLNSIDKQSGLQFSIPCVQITDSSYVAHSERILYRSGYAQFKQLNSSDTFFRYVHSAGALENSVSKDVDKRRVYIDLDNFIVFSVNTQYAGNTVGLKKLSLRLAIHKAAKEGWLAEHMLLMAAQGPKKRVTYLAGAFPSACGKTSTAMLKNEKIIGDDIAYLRIKNGQVKAVNVECGIFGIIRDVNAKDDPFVWEVLNKPGEVIFSNVLLDKSNNPRWLGDKREVPESGINYSGQWTKEKLDAQGKPLPYAHKNARYTVSLYALKNLDPRLDDSSGVEVKGIIYGGRDSDTWPPVQQAFDWQHGVIAMGASLESETTAAILGQEGVRTFNPMSNIDFVAIPLGSYIQNHLEFGRALKAPPAIFGVNYFLKDKNGRYINTMDDKAVWIKWIEQKVNGDVEAVETPTGYIPKFQDLKQLFRQTLNKDYTEQDYNQQFCLRIPENLAKIERIIKIYKTKVSNCPEVLFLLLGEQRQRLEQARNKYGDYIAPQEF
jgi:phosphoenolpyruvate carboxykinase (GTP)